MTREGARRAASLTELLDLEPSAENVFVSGTQPVRVERADGTVVEYVLDGDGPGGAW